MPMFSIGNIKISLNPVSGHMTTSPSSFPRDGFKKSKISIFWGPLSQESVGVDQQNETMK
ncbi:hypothetical protein T06_7899 [Trichinella sp. T6]|nr:hypothetical protein T06_7899 [Trichinella sp. T6]